MNRILVYSLYFLIIFFINPVCIAQDNAGRVGINTENPASSLDVDGTTGLTQGLYLGGDNSSKGDGGLPGQVLSSEGPGKTPVWKDNGYTLPDAGRFFLKQSVVKNDKEGGVISSSSKIGPYPHVINEAIDLTKWHEFKDLTFTIEPEDPLKNIRIVLKIELGVQFKLDLSVNTAVCATNDYWASFSIGVAIKDQNNPDNIILKAVRSGIVDGVQREIIANKLFYEEYVLDDIKPAEQIEVFIVGCLRQNSPVSCAGELYFGRDTFGPSVLNQITARIDVFEEFRFTSN